MINKTYYVVVKVMRNGNILGRNTFAEFIAVKEEEELFILEILIMIDDYFLLNNLKEIEELIRANINEKGLNLTIVINLENGEERY